MRPALAFPVSSLLLALAVGCGSPDTTPIVYNKRPTTKAPAPAAGETNAPTSDVPAAPATTPAPAGGDEIGTETWKDGKQIAANLTIKAGATVEIEPGATITVAAGVAITVKGTLSVKASADHADLAGANWKGIVVASGGTLAADGLDISDAEIGVWTMAGNAGASFLNSSIANAATPFKMEPGSKLSFTKSKVSKATGASVIAGTFTASYMDYDKGSSEGLELSDAAGTMTISDSTLHGLGGGDYVVSRAGKLVKVEYTTITGSHCGLHFDAVDQFIIDHVSDDQNSYGAMLYGSGAGPNQILSSNVRSTEKDLDMSGTNGALTIDKSFTGGKNTLLANAKITNAATAPITDAKPR
jgi:hypothetical protein